MITKTAFKPLINVIFSLNTAAPMKEVKVKKAVDDDDEEWTAPRSSRPSRAAAAVKVEEEEEGEEEEAEPVVTKSGRKVVRPQSPPSVSKAERSPGKTKVLDWNRKNCYCINPCTG